MPRRKPEAIVVWCQRHWMIGLDTNLKEDGVNMFAANEFILQRFANDMEKEPNFDKLVKEGFPAQQVLIRNLEDKAPLCCYYGDEDVKNLLEACRRSRLEKSHPRMNDVERQLIVEGRLEAAIKEGQRGDN